MKKIILFLFSIITILTLTGCTNDTYNINKNVDVTLNINTNLTEYTVTATSGEVSKTKTNQYKISLSHIVSFNVTISKDGYMSKSFYIDSKEFVNGNIEKNVDFNNQDIVKVYVKLSGFIENPKVCIGDINFTREKNTFSSLINKDDLSQINISSDNAEPYVIKISEEEKNLSLLSYDVYLTEKGTKAIKVSQFRNEYVISTDDEIFNVVNNGSESSYVIIPQNFSGDLLFNDKTFNIDVNTPIYGYEINPNELRKMIVIDKHIDLYTEANNGNIYGCFYNGENTVYIDGENTVRLWYIDANSNYRYFTYNGESDIKVDDFKVAKVSNDGYIYNQYGIKLKDQIFRYNDCVVVIKNNIISVSDSSILNITTPDGDHISFHDNNIYNMRYINNKLYRRAEYYKQVQFEVELYTTDNNPVFIKEASIDNPNIVDNKITSSYYYNSIVIRDSNDKLYFARLGYFDINDWSFDGKTFTRKVFVKDSFATRFYFIKNNGNIINFQYLDKKYNNYSYLKINLNEKISFKLYCIEHGMHTTNIIKYEINFADYSLYELNQFVRENYISINL